MKEFAVHCRGVDPRQRDYKVKDKMIDIHDRLKKLRDDMGRKRDELVDEIDC